MNTVFPLPRKARKLLRFIKSLEKEDDSLYRSRLLILVWISKMFFVCSFFFIRPLPFLSSLFLAFFFWGGAPPLPPPPPPATCQRSDEHLLIPCPPPETQGLKANYGQISIQGPASGPLVESRVRKPLNFRGFRHLITVRWTYFYTLFVTLAGYWLAWGPAGGTPRSPWV